MSERAQKVRVPFAQPPLMAFATPSSRSYFISLWDSTAVTDTYQAGRYMRAPLADDDGWTTNRLQPHLQRAVRLHPALGVQPPAPGDLPPFRHHGRRAAPVT